MGMPVSASKQTRPLLPSVSTVVGVVQTNEPGMPYFKASCAQSIQGVSPFRNRRRRRTLLPRRRALPDRRSSASSQRSRRAMAALQKAPQRKNRLRVSLRIMQLTGSVQVVRSHDLLHACGQTGLRRSVMPACTGAAGCARGAAGRAAAPARGGHGGAGRGAGAAGGSGRRRRSAGSRFKVFLSSIVNALRPLFPESCATARFVIGAWPLHVHGLAANSLRWRLLRILEFCTSV